LVPHRKISKTQNTYIDIKFTQLLEQREEEQKLTSPIQQTVPVPLEADGEDDVVTALYIYLCCKP